MQKINGQLKYYKWLIILLFFVMAYYMSWTETDFYFLLATGREFWNGFPHEEFLSMHEGLHYVSQQWLFAAVLYKLHEFFGMAGCYVLVGLLRGATHTAVYLLTLKLTRGNYIFSTVSGLLALIPGAVFLCARPFTASALLLVLVVCVLELYSSGRRGVLCLLPVLSVALINIHASMWPMLFVLMLPYLVESLPLPNFGFLIFKRRNRVTLLIAAAVSALCGFLNPYGLENMLYLTYSYGDSQVNKYIVEMQPATISSLSGMMTFAVLFCGVWALYRARKVYVRYAALFLGTGLLAFMHGRGLLLFLYIGIIAISTAFKWRKASVKTDKPKHFRAIQVLFLVIFFLVIARKDLTLEKEDYQKAVDFIRLQEDSEDAAVFTGYAEGGYAEWTGLKPYIDPRAEVYLEGMNHKEDILYEYFDVSYGRMDTEAFLDKYSFDYVMITEGSPMYFDLEKDDGYEAVYAEEGYVVYRSTG